MAEKDDNNDWIVWGIPVIIIGFLLIVICCLLILRWYIRKPMYKGKARIDGKTVVITGGNTGIGKETARELSKRGGKVVILCRNLEKGNAAAEEIREETNSYVEVYELDLTDLESIRNCAEKLKETQPKIDILINNAGVMMTPKLKTKDGLEMQIGTNHFGHFLLTLLLLNNIKASPPSRIINVSSLAHERTGVTTYALHPGVVSTELTRHIKSTFGSCFNFLMNFTMKFFSKTPLLGAQTSIYCAVEESLQMETGKYYSGCKEKKPSKRARNKEDAERLWKLSLQTVGLDQDFA